MTRKDLKGYETPHNPNRTKGGGRESGGSGPRTLDVPQDTASGAANPAALCPIRQIECLSKEHDERIRALEVENRILTVAMQKEIAKVRALEAELADVRKWLNATHANQQDIVMERNDAVARAEKVEARVKELQARLQDIADDEEDWG